MDRPRLVSTRSILTDRQLLVITLRHRDGLKWGEVAEVMGIAVRVAKRHAAKAEARMKAVGKGRIIIDFAQVGPETGHKWGVVL